MPKFGVGVKSNVAVIQKFYCFIIYILSRYW